ncbi:MAG: hypothetical protein M3466_17145 [Gemmatimonadota bacterium]|nr:hypothetical protein [Gemmatimonadota bacterium]
MSDTDLHGSSLMTSVYQYRIEKDRLAVSIRLKTGENVHGFIFVQPSVYRHLGREEPVDVFNSQAPFIPLITDGGDTFLVSKDQIVEAWPVDDVEADELRRASACSVVLEITLVDGAVRTGAVLLEMPAGRARPLDFLNHHTDRFLTLFADDAIHLVNMRCIERVRPLD